MSDCASLNEVKGLNTRDVMIKQCNESKLLADRYYKRRNDESEPLDNGVQFDTLLAKLTFLSKPKYLLGIGLVLSRTALHPTSLVETRPRQR